MTEQVQKTEDELMQEAQALIDARRNEGKLPPKPEALEPIAAAEPETPEPAAPDGETPAEPAAPDEPFEGYNALPEAVRKKWDELNQKAAEAERLRADGEKLRNDFNALHNRLAPVQRELDKLQRASANQPRQSAPSLSVEDWAKSLTPQMQKYYREFPEEARAAFEIARSVTERTTADIEQRFEGKLHEIERRAELAVLSREHPDFRDYSKVRGQPATPKAAEFWNTWLPNQPEHIQSLVHSDSAEDTAAALSLFKWEQRPEVQAAIAEQREPAFQSWLAQQPSTLAAAIYSPRIDDRIAVWRLFDQHLKLQEVGQQAEPDPQAAARVAQLAARREQQGKASPSIRQTVAPPSAATDGNDAGWAAAVAAARQYHQR